MNVCLFNGIQHFHSIQIKKKKNKSRTSNLWESAERQFSGALNYKNALSHKSNLQKWFIIILEVEK